jgi:hypothetical protein
LLAASIFLVLNQFSLKYSWIETCRLNSDFYIGLGGTDKLTSSDKRSLANFVQAAAAVPALVI